MMDKDGIVTLWNKSAEKTYGFSQKEVLGKLLHHLIIPPKKYDIDHSINLKTFSQTGQSPILGKILEVETINKAGKIIPIELSVSSVEIKNQKYAIGIIRDISIRKENEFFLVKANEEIKKSQLAILNVLEDIKEEKARTDAICRASVMVF